MAPTSAKAVSSITAALAGQTASVKIPKPREVGNLTDHGDADNAATGHDGLLPTPPNSISPPFPPRKTFSQPVPPSSHTPPLVESDVDLQQHGPDPRPGRQPQALSSAALSGVEAAGAITPALLAKRYLPDILSNGPVAIRHVLGTLTQTVPGFSRIPSAKARRLVVGALESRAGGGMNGEVEFEKVGWGRWDARLKGQLPQEHDNQAEHPSAAAPLLPDHEGGMSPPPSMPESYSVSNPSGVPIPRGMVRWKSTGAQDPCRGSWALESVLSSREEETFDMNMAEHEADKMSLDGDRLYSTSSGDANTEPGLDALEELTDEEDWARIGPDALRRDSLPPAGMSRLPTKNYNHLSIFTSRMRSLYGEPTKQHNHGHHHRDHHNHRHNHRASSHSRYPHHRRQLRGSRSTAGLSLSQSRSRSHPGSASCSVEYLGVGGHDSQEREAIEALLRMGSM